MRHHTKHGGPGLAILVLLIGAAAQSGCSSKPAGGSGSLTPPFLETPLAPRPATNAATVARGKQVYDANCVQCHGASGTGDGYGAPFLVPPPRDFTAGQFKFRTTSSGQLPSDEDLFRLISRGANGTGMPPWMYLLPDEDRWALVDYVKTFDERFASGRALKPMPLPDAPGRSRSIDRGREAYAKMQCAKCHGEDGRGVGPSSATMVDAKGRYVNARDFTQPGSYRTGWTEREIIRTLETGMNGVPMPSYSGVMSKQEEYDLVAYVLSLAKHGSDQKRQMAKSMDGVGAPDRVIQLREHAWKYEPSEIRVKRGEVVKIEFSATDNGLGAGHGFALDGLDQSVFINGAMVGAPLSVTFKVDDPGRYNFYCSTQCSTTELHPHMHGVLVVE
ncbi:MAG TPA: c-type cytochrome [Vicinamibacterales bacterium]|jgi:mono/diheme cytochrome c family protein|nr:c-type cytochrome [Vicinamibacterales bacterium]